MTSKFLTELTNDYKELFETKIGHDVIIYAGKEQEEQEVKEIHAHSSILCIRSKYFRSAFSDEWAEKKDGKFIFRKPNISSQSFDIILRFIYYGSIELINLQGPDILKLLIAVDELGINSLISYIQEYLIKHQIKFLHKDPIEILETVHQHETFTDLWNFYLKESKIIFNSDKFINLKAPLLELLLKMDDLNVNEVDIWKGLLKWCFAQQNIKSGPTELSKEDITNIEKLLNRFIPLIRFYDIESTDFFYEVYCYKDVIPQVLIHDLLEFHLVTNLKPKTNISLPRKPNLKLDSNLIKSNYYVTLFSSWIDKKDLHYNIKNAPYNFKLLHRSSRDGFGGESFHRNCDDKGATIWIAKIKDSAQLVGGYNPLDWCGATHKRNENSFIFNFTDGKDISTANLGYVKRLGSTIFCNNDRGPHMGDLYFSCSDGCIYNKHSYPIMDIPGSFKVDDYEVFQVIKK